MDSYKRYKLGIGTMILFAIIVGAYANITSPKPPITEVSNVKYSPDGRYTVVDFDSCEYVLYRDALTHKGNCRYCAARNKSK